MRFSDTRAERAIASKSAFHLPCSSTPLQSITAATSHRFPCVPASAGVCAGQNTGRFGGCCAPGSRLTRGWVSNPVGFFASELARDPTRRTGSFVASSLALRTRPRPGADVFPPESGGRSSEPASNCISLAGRRVAPDWGRRLRDGSSPEPLGAFAELPWRVSLRDAERQRAGFVPQGDPKVALLQVPTEMGSLGKTRSGSTMTPPMGFGSFRREKPR